MARVSKPITATENDVILLKKLSLGADATLALRANIILKCIELPRNKDVANALSIDERSVALWKERYRQDGISGLSRIHGGGKTTSIDLTVLDHDIKTKTSESNDWTINSLANDLGVSEYVVKSSLSRQGIQRKRVHSWTKETSDEIISKYIDIRGLYLSFNTCAIIICSSNSLPQSTVGLFTTKNRLLAKDLEVSVENITIADALIAARKYCKKPASGKYETLASFFSEVLDNVSTNEQVEWHIFLRSDHDIVVKGNIRTDIHIEKFDNDDKWLSQVKGWIAGTYETSRFDQIGNLFTAIKGYLDSCEKDAEPFLWKKKNNSHLECSIPTTRERETTQNESLISQSVESLIEKIEQDPTKVKMGALLVLKDRDDLSVGEILPAVELPSPGTFDFSSPESMGVSIGNAEEPILSFARELELQMLKLYIDNVKKNKAD